jgi:hypothetical protein
MNVIVFVNRSITPDLNTKFLGHVGWGFKLRNGHYLYGSKEATPAEFEGHFPPGTISNGSPNGVFTREASLEKMIDSLRGGGKSPGPRFPYHEYKMLEAPNVYIDEAVALAMDSKNWGYGLFGNNCMDDVFKIIKAYSGDDKFLPWPSTNPRPNGFYDAINAESVVL